MTATDQVTSWRHKRVKAKIIGSTWAGGLRGKWIGTFGYVTLIAIYPDSTGVRLMESVEELEDYE